MADTALEKAKLYPLKPDLVTVDDSADAKKKVVTVQFNPDTLKVAYANQIEKPEGSGDQRGTQAQQYVGAGSTKLTCTLWFDVSAPQPSQNDTSANAADDVRKLTGLVAYYMTAVQDKKDPKKFVPPAVRFAWGSFHFDGIMEGLEESIELFSPDGRPLRASVAIAITQQKIVIFPPGRLDASGKPVPGTTPTTAVPQGSSVQKMAGEKDWQKVAQANNVEQPRLAPAGRRLDMNPR